jgi:hypothetical protein
VSPLPAAYMARKVLTRLLECFPPGANPWHYQGNTMKTQAKKLALAKETVKNMESDKLQEVHGGLCLSEDVQRSCS